MNNAYSTKVLAAAVFTAVLSAASAPGFAGPGKAEAVYGPNSAKVMASKMPLQSAVKAIRACTNPAVVKIRFRVVSRTGPNSGRVQILGILNNKGTAAYTSTWPQQELRLYENGRLVKVKKFRKLAVGQSIRVKYERNWNAARAPGRTPPNYTAMVVYDPDIYLDGNPRNDDCVSGDNKLRRSGARINSLLRS